MKLSRKTVGVLGGMGPAATADFFRLLVKATDAQTDQEHLHVLIDSDPSVPDRTEALLDGGRSPVPHLIGMAQRLESAGAELLVMPCNTAHAFVREIACAVNVPLLDWIQEVVDHVAAEDEPPKTVGVLATTGAIRAGLYQERLAKAGIAAVVPHEEDQRQLMETIYGPRGLKAGWTEQPAAVDIAQRLANRDTDALLVACTDLSVLRLGNRLDSTRVYDTAEIVAERIVRRAGGIPVRHAGVR